MAMSARYGILFVFLLLTGVFGAPAPTCGSASIDPPPYKLLEASLLKQILVYAFPEVQEYVNISNYDAIQEKITLRKPVVDTATAESVLLDYIAGYGYKATLSDWTSTDATLTFDATAPSPKKVPFFRLFLLLFGPSTIPGKDVWVSKVPPASDFEGTSHISRVAVLALNAPPKDQNDAAAKFKTFFCEKGVDVRVVFTGLESGVPTAIISEILPETDECAAGTEGCVYQCVDGTKPFGGYTCKNKAGANFGVDEQGVGVLAVAKNMLSSYGMDTEGFEDVVVNANVVTYRILLSPPGSGTTVNLYLPALEPVIESYLAPIDANRLSFAVDVDSLLVTIDYPVSISLTFYSDKDGKDLLALKQAVYDILNLDPTSPASQAAISVEYDDSTNIATIHFNEDVTDTTSTTFEKLSCQFAQALGESSNRALIVKAGYSVDIKSLKFSKNDSGCDISKIVGSDSSRVQFLSVLVTLALGMNFMF